MPSQAERRTDDVINALEAVTEEQRALIDELRLLILTERRDQERGRG